MHMGDDSFLHYRPQKKHFAKGLGVPYQSMRILSGQIIYVVGCIKYVQFLLLNLVQNLRPRSGKENINDKTLEPCGLFNMVLCI